MRSATSPEHTSAPIAGFLPHLLMLVLLGVGGCVGDQVVGSLTDGGAPARTGPYDECGNGMDDDGDGQIDEGCFCGGDETQSCFSGSYPNRGVGACVDGVQACTATGATEFGSWGACTMDTLPTAEACDGVDNNCDGAVDEGCPCAVGETQVCGAEFRTSPCTPGTQSCQSDGTWSPCEGAVGPSAELCGAGPGDGIDNDCDGTADEGCSCVPRAEECGDGIDNDCDGIVDEAACAIPMASDGGIPDAGPVDGGGCTPEVCDGVDNDCDGAIDEECDVTCECSTGDTWRSDFAANALAVETADDGTRLLVHRIVTDSRLGIATYHTQVITPLGVAMPPVMIYDGGARFHSVRWAFDQFVVLLHEGHYTSAWPVGMAPFGWRVSATGAVLGSYALDALDTGLAVENEYLHVFEKQVLFVREDSRRRVLTVECRRFTATAPAAGYSYRCIDRALLLWTLDADLAPMGAPVRVNAVGDERLRSIHDAVADGPNVVVGTSFTNAVPVGAGLPPTLVFGWSFQLIAASRVSAETDTVVSTTAAQFRIKIARGSDRFIACMNQFNLRNSGSVTCRFFGFDGMPAGPQFEAMTGPLGRQELAVSWSDCTFLVAAGGFDNALRVSLVDPLHGTHVEMAPSTTLVTPIDQALSLANDGTLVMAVGTTAETTFEGVSLMCR